MDFKTQLTKKEVPYSRKAVRTNKTIKRKHKSNKNKRIKRPFRFRLSWKKIRRDNHLSDIFSYSCAMMSTAMHGVSESFNFFAKAVKASQENETKILLMISRLENLKNNSKIKIDKRQTYERIIKQCEIGNGFDKAISIIENEIALTFK